MTDQENPAADLDKFAGAPVLCVGDVMLDRFVYGKVSRISPEAPVPVCLVSEESAMLGGAGNVVRNLAALGAAATFIGIAGDDEPGREVKSLLGELDGVSMTLITDKSRPTTIKERFISGGQQLLRVDREVSDAPAPSIDKKLRKAAEKAIPDAAALVLSDYDKGALSRETVAALIEAARQNNVPVIVDPKGDDYSWYAGAYLITPNTAELGIASRLPADGDDAVIAAARQLQEKCRLENILVTRSARGMTLVGPRDTRHFDAEAREVFDVSGAGDTVVATLAAARAGGVPLDRAVRLANVAAGIVVGKIGTAVVWRGDIAEALHRQDTHAPGSGKVLPLDRALERIESWRKRGERIGFTNGCFDLIHPGHVTMLARSRAACDRLVVGLNSDASVKRLKGEARPIQNEDARATVMASLASVDLVVVFGEDTPIELIRAIKPDVLTKGADYARDEVVGAEIIDSYGGEVRPIDLEEGHSTTATVARISESEKS